MSPILCDWTGEAFQPRFGPVKLLLGNHASGVYSSEAPPCTDRADRLASTPDPP